MYKCKQVDIKVKLGPLDAQAISLQSRKYWKIVCNGEPGVYTQPLMATALYLTSPELSQAVEQLDGVRLPSRTLGSWASSGLLVPSIDWAKTQRVPRLYSLRDLAKARLLVRLRQAKFGAARVRVIMAHIEQNEPNLFAAGSRAVLTFDGWRTEVRIQKPGEPVRRVPSGQLELPLADVMNGNEEVVKGIRRVA